jgi:ABC-type Fe3+-siderophore transport system permease subunit
MSLFNNPNRIPENYGLRTAAGLIVFFLIMRFIDKGHHVELRLLNLFILGAGIFYGLKKFRDSHSHQIDYFRALITGVAIGAVGSALFALFLFAYMKLDPSFMQSIIDNEPMGRYLNAYMAAFIVSLEGFFSGLIVTFVLINYVATDKPGQA